MAVATIVSVLGARSFLVQYDTGAAERAAALDALNARHVQLTLDIATATLAAAAAEDAEAPAAADYRAATDAYAAALLAEADAQAIDAALTAMEAAKQTWMALQSTTRLARTELTALQHADANVLRELAQWTTFEPSVTVPATDVMHRGSLGGVFSVGMSVTTMEANGEPQQAFVSGSTNIPSGTMRARQTMTPEQAFLNAALLPGWQKFRPTYRVATVTAVDVHAPSVTVALAADAAYGLHLGINQSNTLTITDIRYNGGLGIVLSLYAFVPGDSVLVGFDAQDWTRPFLIGFAGASRNGAQAYWLAEREITHEGSSSKLLRAGLLHVNNPTASAQASMREEVGLFGSDASRTLSVEWGTDPISPLQGWYVYTDYRTHAPEGGPRGWNLRDWHSDPSDLVELGRGSLGGGWYVVFGPDSIESYGPDGGRIDVYIDWAVPTPPSGGYTTFQAPTDEIGLWEPLPFDLTGTATKFGGFYGTTPLYSFDVTANYVRYGDMKQWMVVKTQSAYTPP